MSPITTHVLDTALGRPAEGVLTILEFEETAGWRELGRGRTNVDGRIRDLVPAEASLPPGVYRLRFQTAAYFESLGVRAFYPEVPIHFSFDPAGGHYHVPLLLSPFGYSTYRGS